MSYQHTSPNSSTLDAAFPINRLFVDLDGCIFDNLGRKVGVPDDPFDTAGWFAFEAACEDDKVIQMVADIVRHFKNTYNCQIVFLTGRTERCMEKTVVMLNHHIISEWDGLIMRPVDEKRWASEWKIDMLRQLGCCSGDMIMDDCLNTIMEVAKQFPEASFMYTNFGMCQSKIKE